MSVKTYSIDFLPLNEQLILEGKKTTTLRTDSQAIKIGMKEGEVGVLVLGGRSFKVSYIGLISASEYPDIWKTEGFDYTGGPKFPSTKQFLNGERRLHLYVIDALR